jgi:vitamin B12 transporter
VETFLDLKPLKALTVRGSYTYTNIQTTIPASQPTTPLLQKPANQAGLDLDYQSDAWEAGVSASYVGQRPDFDFWAYAPVTLSEYFLVNLRASFQVDDHVKLFARVDNLFNQSYEQAYGYGTPGLSVYAGTKASF